MRSLLTMIVITMAVAACGGSAPPRRATNLISCGQVATTYWGDQSVRLNNCADQFGTGRQIQVQRNQLLAVDVVQDWAQRFPRIESSNQAVLARSAASAATPRANTVVVAAFRAVRPGAAYLYVPEGSLPEAPCIPGPCASNGQLILTRVSVTT
jgi:hypothetical protein